MQIPKTPVEFNSNNNLSGLKILQYTVLTVVILYFGKALFIPLSFSLLISFILYPVCKWLEEKGINRGIAIGIAIFAITIFLSAILYLFLMQLLEFSREWSNLRLKITGGFNQISLFLNESLGVSTEKQSDLIKNFSDNSATQLVQMIQTTAYSISESAFFLIIVPVFSALILYHRQLFANVLYSFFSSEKKETIHEILVETIHSYYNFIKGMLLVYLIVGVLNSMGLAIIGIPHPILFGFTASVLTFIPYIGILVASLLPITVAWITFGSIWYPLGVILVFTIVQILEANVIFPIAVSNRLNVNTMVLLIMIIAGGIIWGGAGMILFIPFLSIIKLIADRSEKLKTLSMLLGNGNKNIKK